VTQGAVAARSSRGSAVTGANGSRSTRDDEKHWRPRDDGRHERLCSVTTTITRCWSDQFFESATFSMASTLAKG